jgi:DNA-binding beta-propeller fold protein YncE
MDVLVISCLKSGLVSNIRVYGNDQEVGMTRRSLFLGFLLFFIFALTSSWLWGATLYGVNNATGNLFLITIDTTTGASTTVGPLTHRYRSIAFAPDGTLYAASDSSYQLVILDPATGAVVTELPSWGVGQHIEGLAVRPTDSVVFGIDPFTNSLYIVNTATGAVSIVGSPSAVLAQINGLAFNLDGSVLYGISYADGCLYTIDQSTAVVTLVGCGPSEGPTGLARDPVTGTLFAVNYLGSGLGFELATVSEVDGSRTTVGPTTGYVGVAGLSFDQEVPVELMQLSVE